MQIIFAEIPSLNIYFRSYRHILPWNSPALTTCKMDNSCIGMSISRFQLVFSSFSKKKNNWRYISKVRLYLSQKRGGIAFAIYLLPIWFIFFFLLSMLEKDWLGIGIEFGSIKLFGSNFWNKICFKINI